jgi:hypothetical protein
MEISADFKKGFIEGIKAVFIVLLENMDDEVKESLFKELKLKEYE